MNTLRIMMCWLLGLLLIAAGLNHFRDPDFYTRVMPPYLPWHRALVLVSGVTEVVLGLLLLVPRYRVAAAWGAIALLVAVFPANLHMAMHPELFPTVPPVLLSVRLPLQGAFIAWANWFTRHPAS